jgi:hypothetical protein
MRVRRSRSERTVVISNSLSKSPSSTARIIAARFNAFPDLRLIAFARRSSRTIWRLKSTTETLDQSSCIGGRPRRALFGGPASVRRAALTVPKSIGHHLW